MPILGIQKGAVVSAVGTNGLLADGEMKPRRIAPNAGAENGEVSIAINAAFAGTSGLKTTLPAHPAQSQAFAHAAKTVTGSVNRKGRKMGLNFYKGINLGAGFRLNVTKSGLGLSGGVRGLRVGLGPRGGRFQATLPGTGIYYRKTAGWKTLKGGGITSGAQDSPMPATLESSGGDNVSAVTIGNPAKALIEAWKYFQANQFENSLKFLDYILRQNNAESDAHFTKGLFQYSCGNITPALESLKAANRRPKRLGHLYAESGLILNSKLQLTKEIAVDIQPDTTSVVILIAECLQDSGDSDSALQALFGYLKHNPDQSIAALSALEIACQSPRPDKYATEVSQLESPAADPALSCCFQTYKARFISMNENVNAAHALLVESEPKTELPNEVTAFYWKTRESMEQRAGITSQSTKQRISELIQNEAAAQPTQSRVHNLPTEEKSAKRRNFALLCLNMSYLMMAADGSVDEQEIVELEQYFASSPKLTGINVRNTLTNIQTKFRPSDMNGVLSIVSVDDLAPDEVFDALVLAFNIAVADGEFSDSERDMLLGIANALNVPEEKTIELIKRLEQVLADSLLEEDE